MRHPRHNDPAPGVASMSAFVGTDGVKRGRMAWAGHVGGARQGSAAVGRGGGWHCGPKSANVG